MRICWLPKPVRYASVYSLQPTGEAQSVPAGYQTDTRHSTEGLWDTGWPTGCTGAGSCFRGTDPSHANTTEQLHTSPPGDQTVRFLYQLLKPDWFAGTGFLYIIFHYFRYMEALEDTLTLPLCGLLLILLSAMCFVAFSAITVKFFHWLYYQESLNCLCHLISSSVHRTFVLAVYFTSLIS
jgi:hypothetical protein